MKRAGRERGMKKGFARPVIAGFGALYLLTMGLATWLVKEKTVEDYGRRFEETAVSILREASEKEFSMEQEGWAPGERKEFYQALANQFYRTAEEDSLRLSMAFYDEKLSLLAQSRDEISSTGWTGAQTGDEVLFGLDEFLSPAKKEELAAYQWENISAGYQEPQPCRISVRLSADDGELWEIMVQRIVWEEGEEGRKAGCVDPVTGAGHMWQIGGGIDYATGLEMGSERIFYETDSQVVWKWENQELSSERRDRGRTETVTLNLPYMNAMGSEEAWKRWKNSAFLQDFPAQVAPYWEAGTEYPLLMTNPNPLYYRARYQLQIGMAGSPFSYMEIRMEERPWLTAFDEMKYIWLAGLALSLTCMVKVIVVFGRITDRQAEMETARRDFLNAMAHELKTPLGVIRNFAENLLEHNMEEKRDYYLSRIIEQTGEMDRLVADMIEVSKLDSQNLELKKEPVGFRELLREQAARFEPLLEEKNLRVEYQEEGEFLVNADREYLSKAVWNLLSNAVDYNLPGGSILIRTETDRCVIENTGIPLKEEQLRHAFDLLYTGEESRSRKEGHTGMGLYLASRILSLHGLSLTLENAGLGIRAVIKKQG